MKYFLLILFISSFVLAECNNNQININSASIKKLDDIIWVGPATAEKIINERPFNSLNDLDNVHGIGEIKINDIIDEGLACIDDNNGEKEIIKGKEKVAKINLEKPTVEIISLNEHQINEEIVYESKNSLVMNYLPYVFSVFLILIVITLIYTR